MKMILIGKAHKLGDNINTDDIIAAKYLITTDEKELGKHCMENILPYFSKKIKKGDIIVAGKNFGCGSSREHAPLAIKGCGISAVIAQSFSPIFFRNAINVGLVFLELPYTEEIYEGDNLELDLNKGIIRNINRNKIYSFPPFPEFLHRIIKEGGLINYIKKARLKYV
ncbi:MAG: 3-isopropylmalate dehydratase small subunit [Candidatus Omnitrophica bacterium]|nr:3-isopropylmalate dehydratase small subunit [Candidatus Omnitrophota bacterium]